MAFEGYHVGSYVGRCRSAEADSASGRLQLVEFMWVSAW
jgi:hypothetical protein